MSITAFINILVNISCDFNITVILQRPVGSFRYQKKVDVIFILKVFEKCRNFYFGIEKLPPKF